MKKRLLTIIGARPQIIKAAALSRAISSEYSQVLTEDILHTGQHYDANMSEVFFTELGIPAPCINLQIGSGLHGKQTAKMITAIEQVLCSGAYDGVVLYGDTNSTLAGAVAASKVHCPIFHIEAGLRSFNMAMPEEVNRIVCDQLSSLLFAPTQTAYDNLEREGFTTQRYTFANGKSRRVVLSGDVMYDNALHFAAEAEQRCTLLDELGLHRSPFVLATIHRNNNTDSAERLTNIFTALCHIAESMPIVLPLHPRTAKMMEVNLPANLYARVKASERIRIIPPVSFLRMLLLEKRATVVLTDSGGVQKEAFFVQTPTVIVRPETEWVEIVEHGAGIVTDATSSEAIVAGYEAMLNVDVNFPPLFGDGRAAEHIAQQIVDYL